MQGAQRFFRGKWELFGFLQRGKDHTSEPKVMAQLKAA